MIDIQSVIERQSDKRTISFKAEEMLFLLFLFVEKQNDWDGEKTSGVSRERERERWTRLPSCTNVGSAAAVEANEEKEKHYALKNNSMK